VGEVFPGAGDAFDVGLAAQLAVGAHFTSHAGHFGGERPELIHHSVDRVLELLEFAFDIDGDLRSEERGVGGDGDVGDVAHLGGQIAGHDVDGVGEVFPGAGHAANVGLTAQFAVGADFASHTGHFGGERPELIHHSVDRVLEFLEFAFDIDGDF